MPFKKITKRVLNEVKAFESVRFALAPFQGIELAETSFAYCIFNSCDLTSTTFKEISTTSLRVESCLGDGTVFTKSRFLKNNNFSHCHFASLRFLDCCVDTLIVSESSLIESSISECTFESFDLVSSTIQEGLFLRTNLSSLKIESCVFKDFTFGGGSATTCDFKKSVFLNLSSSDFQIAHGFIDRCQWHSIASSGKAPLFQNCIFVKTLFSGSINLLARRKYFIFAVNSSFNSCSFSGAFLADLDFNEGVAFADCSFKRTTFRKVRFKNCSFKNCNLSAAIFKDCSFENVQFINCMFIAAQIKECFFNQVIFAGGDSRNLQVVKNVFSETTFENFLSPLIFSFSNQDDKGCEFTEFSALQSSIDFPLIEF